MLKKLVHSVAHALGLHSHKSTSSKKTTKTSARKSKAKVAKKVVKKAARSNKSSRAKKKR